ncbi:hypothetical protein B0H10DRAFT_2215217 [Mycena sp. CBHHK59/15]|nr:hypothetical protein B0H10DRAFT_2215217 [Mycena sp. CBHHK59/15]
MAAGEEKQSQRRFLRNQLHKKRKAQRDNWENSQCEISQEDVSLEAAAAYAALLVVQDQQLVKSGKSWLVTPEDEYQLQLDGEDKEGKAQREQDLNLDFQESAEADAEFWSTMSSMGSRSGLHNYQSSLSPELTKLLEAAKRQLFEQLVPFFEVHQALFRALQPFDGLAEANNAALYLLGWQLKHIFRLFCLWQLEKRRVSSLALAQDRLAWSQVCTFPTTCLSQ